MRGVVAMTDQPGDHAVFVLVEGGTSVLAGTSLPPGQLYLPDESELIVELDDIAQVRAYRPPRRVVDGSGALR